MKQTCDNFASLMNFVMHSMAEAHSDRPDSFIFAQPTASRFGLVDWCLMALSAQTGYIVP